MLCTVQEALGEACVPNEPAASDRHVGVQTEHVRMVT